MRIVPQPPEIDRLGDPVVRTIRDAWDRILAEQEAIRADPVKATRLRALRELERSVAGLMDEVDAEARRWLEETFPRVYARGVADASAALGQEFSWSVLHAEAVQALAQESFDDLLRSTRFVRRTTKQLVRVLAREQVSDVLLAGRTAVQGGRTLAELLDAHRIYAVRYKDGSRHGLAEYGEMVVRTRSASAYNVGTLNQGRSFGVAYYEVLDGADCGWINHDDNDKANATIRSAEECAKSTLSHPNCRRSFAPRPEITTPEEARSGVPTTTEAQRADQAASERARAADLRGRSARRAAIARSSAREPWQVRRERALAGRQAALTLRARRTGTPAH